LKIRKIIKIKKYGKKLRRQLGKLLLEIRKIILRPFVYLTKPNPSRVCLREEAQIRLLRHLTQNWDVALNFVLKIVEFL
jgi:hypothetical protein